MIYTILISLLVVCCNGCSFAMQHNIDSIDLDDFNLINNPHFGEMKESILAEQHDLLQSYTHRTQEEIENADQRRQEEMILAVQSRRDQDQIRNHYEGAIATQQVVLSLLEERRDSIGRLAINQQNSLSCSFNTQLRGRPSQTNLVQLMTATIRENTTEINKHEEDWRSQLEDFDLGGAQREGEENPFTVGLALDGGGMRGLVTARLLQHIEDYAGGRRIYELVDFIGGTSIGGILALGLSSKKPGQQDPLDTEELVGLFREHATTIFPDTPFKELKQLYTNIYPQEGIEGVLLNYFGSQQTLRDTLRPVLVTAVTTHQQPFIFETSKAMLSLADDFFIKDVARATSSAPTYFPAAKIQSVNGAVEHELLDGGVWCNNPSRLVYDALKGYQSTNLDSDIAIISIGTGEALPSRIEARAGLLHAQPIITAMGRTHVTGVNESMQSILGNKFYRIQPDLGFDIKLDEKRAEYLENLEACAETRYSKAEDVARFLLKNFDLKFN